jgi:Na+/proline symporter
MFGLHPYDIVVIVGYLLLMAVVGVAVARGVKDTGHYFLGNRRFGKLLMIGQSFGIGTHADQPVGTAGKSYQLGFSGLWFGWKFIFCTPFYWLIAPIYRRLRVVTSADYMEARYGRGVGLVYGIYALVFLMMNVSAMQNGAAKVVAASTSGAIPHAVVVWSMTVIFIGYSFLGGRISAAVTDVLQSVLIIVLSFLIIPFGLQKLGGFDAFKAVLTDEQRSLAIPGGLTFGLITILSIQSLFSIFAQPQQMAAVGTGKTELNCRIGFTYGNMIKRFCTIGWSIVGLIVLAMVARGMIAPLPDHEGAFGVACQQLLGPGFLGLMVASVLATNMSTCSAMMVDLGALFIQNVYKPYLRPAAADSHYLLVGRCASVVLILASMSLIHALPNVLDALLQSDSLAAFMGVSFIAGLVWRRANRVGAICAFVVGMGTNMTLSFSRHGNITEWHMDLFLYSLLASIAALVVGSLATRPEPVERWTFVQDRLHTPVSADDTPPAELKARAQQAEANGEGLLIADLGQLHRTFSFRRYRTDLLGAGGALVIVGALILLALAIARA